MTPAASPTPVIGPQSVEELSHPVVLVERVGHEPADACCPRPRSQAVQEERADTVSLPRTGDNERHLRIGGACDAVIAPDGHDLEPSTATSASRSS